MHLGFLSEAHCKKRASLCAPLRASWCSHTALLVCLYRHHLQWEFFLSSDTFWLFIFKMFTFTEFSWPHCVPILSSGSTPSHFVMNDVFSVC